MVRSRGCRGPKYPSEDLINRVDCGVSIAGTTVMVQVSISHTGTLGNSLGALSVSNGFRAI